MTDRALSLARFFQQAGRGWFISFEGGDGSGKSTQLRLLTEALNEEGAPVLATREPGGTDLGLQLRNLVQHGPEDVDARTEALLYAADRAYHVATVIRPALDQGLTVLEDRYIDSSVAYQGAARQLGTEEVEGLSLWATENLLPDLTLLFDVPVELGLERAGATPDRLERAGIDFHRRVRQQYLALADAHPDRIIVIDGVGSVQEVFHRMTRALWEAVGK